MIDSDYQTFSEAWTDAHEIMPGGKVLSPGAMTMCFDAISRYPIDVVLLAIKRHVATGKFAPIPKDIIDILEAGNNHVGADEAWAIVIESMDERTTVVMTQEMQEARAIAWSVWESGDEVGARMAFRDAYNRIIKTAPVPRWSVSLGFDVEGRVSSIGRAVELGQLTQEEAKRYLPAPREGGLIAGLLTGKVVDMPKNNAELRGRWESLKQAMLDGQARLEERERQEREQQRLRREQRRAEVLARVAEKIVEGERIV
jgi:hypothetical protein